VLPTTSDEADPLLHEEEKLNGRKRSACEELSTTGTSKKQRPEDAEDEQSSLIANAISQGTEKICKALEQQTSTLLRVEKAVSRQREESVRLERRVNSILCLLEDKIRSESYKKEQSKSVKSVVKKK
jgi:hypothetical protein